MKYMMPLCVILCLSFTGISQQTSTEPHRPKIHFSPAKGWMNDPNGMVYFNGLYHLFFQHYPDSTVWGPMHWGHATSKDLVHWTEQKIALYPDTLGTIFSGSAVIDVNNTAGFGKNAMVAIYTNHSHELEKSGSDKFQTQSIAYSLDEGKSWEKYTGNPVVTNPGIRDFRDPKVFWYEEQKKWIMTLATLDHITFYSSPDLKKWREESKFGKNVGAHGGVWECPDLFRLNHNNKDVWVLIVNINPGGPNGGSATQYFLGDFDGSHFTAFDNDIRWLDYGPDEYAGITWSNTGKRKIFMGWMSNWLYANQVPTEKWRSAMTVARELALKQEGGKYFVTSMPVREIEKTAAKNKVGELDKLAGPAIVRFASANNNSFQVELSNSRGERLVIGYDSTTNKYFIDRSKAGKADFNRDFAKRHEAPRLTMNGTIDVTLIVDVASVELFADNGLTVMTSVFFPNEDFNKISVDKAVKGLSIRSLAPKHSVVE